MHLSMLFETSIQQHNECFHMTNSREYVLNSNILPHIIREE